MPAFQGWCATSALNGMHVSGPDGCIRVPVSLADNAPKDAVLMQLYHHWNSLRHGVLLPDRMQVSFARLLPALPLITLMNVAPADPSEFFVVFHGEMLPAKMHGAKRALGSFSPPLREMWIEDFSAVKRSGEPAYHKVVALLEGDLMSFSRLILPFAEDGQNVSELFVARQMERHDDLIAQLIPASKTSFFDFDLNAPDPRGF